MYDKTTHPYPLLEEDFDIWFRHHMRCRLRNSGYIFKRFGDYAKLLGEDEAVIKAVAEGFHPPTTAILTDMGLTDDEYDCSVSETVTTVLRRKRYI